MAPQSKSYSSISYPSQPSPSHSDNNSATSTSEHSAANQGLPLVCNCTSCPKSFKFRSELDRHLTVHTKSRPYACSYPDCKKSFKRSDALASHYRNHVKARVFECTIEGCNSTFTTKSALKYHNMRHMSEKNFKCAAEGCGKAFITSAQLKQHMKNNHKQDISKQAKSETTVTASEKVEDNYSYNYFEENDREPDFGDFSDLSPMLNTNINLNDSMLKLEDYNVSNPNSFYNANKMLLKLYKDATGAQEETSAGKSVEYSPTANGKVEKKFSSMLTNILLQNDQIVKKFKANEESQGVQYNARPSGDVDQFFNITDNREFGLDFHVQENYGYNSYL